MSEKLKPALFGGIIIGLISGIPFLNLINCLCCAGVLFGGFMSVYFYKQDLPPGGAGVTNSDAMQLGALAGAIGAIIGTIITAIIMALAGNIAGQAMYNFIEGSGILENAPPGTLEKMQQDMSQGGLNPFFIFVGLIIDAVFGLLGGLIGYSVFKQKNPMPPQMPPMSPPQ